MRDAPGSRRKSAIDRLGLVAVALAFVAAVFLVNSAFRGLRLDLTENQLYTLSDGTRRIVESIPEPVNLYLFFSAKATADIPYLHTYAGRVQEMLEEFARRSNGKLVLKVVDPLPFSEEEDQAAAFGLRSLNGGNGGDPIYLGVAGTNSVGDDEIIPFLDPSKEAFLEYELAKLVYTLANPRKPVVGLLSSLPMTAGFDPLTQQPTTPWAVTDQLGQFFELRLLENGLRKIDDQVKVLMLVHPQDLADDTLYAIDQFLLRGGRALIFVDPFAEIQRPGPGGAPGGRSSDLRRLLDAWGLAVDPRQVVGDDRYALSVAGADNRPVRHLGIIGVDRDGINQDDVITSGLNALNLAFAGHITRRADAPAKLVPLVQSSSDAALLPAERLAFMPDPELLRNDFAPTGQRYLLAARVTGPLPSAFPEGPPAGAPAGNHLKVAAEPAQVVLVADVDLLADRLWVQSQDLFGQRVSTAFANNGDLVINALDNLLGSSDLISIRSRATFQRPFTRVQALRREAEGRFRSAEARLQDELRDTEDRLVELQANRADQGAAILTPEQQKEIERFQARRLELRRELRQVQRGLDQDIEDLGKWLKAINIALVPLLVSLLSVALLAWRRRRRRTAAP